MVSSKAKKKEKKKDFQKAKFKVGKARPKAANHTDTSFKARKITVNQQSLGTDAPSHQAQFTHHVGLLSSASEVQRKESLNWLETALTQRSLTWSGPELLDRLLPLLQDANGSVRSRLIKTLNALPKDQTLKFLAEKILLHITAGMTNINVNIRASALEILDWAIETCGIELVECKGGWFNMLKTFLAMLGWSTLGESSTGWSSNMTPTGDTKNVVKALDTLTSFLRLGMTGTEDQIEQAHIDWWKLAVRMHTKPDPYRSLGIYAQPGDDKNAFTRDAAHRREMFLEHFRSRFEHGIKELRKQAGEAGRAAAKISDVIMEAMKAADAAKSEDDTWRAKMIVRERSNREKIYKHGFSVDAGNYYG